MLLYLLLFGVVSALANTEIVNFEATLEKGAVVGEWPVLDSTNNEIQLTIPALRREEYAKCTSPCANEAILKLNLDTGKWDKFHKFTLRLSYPAFYPSDIKLSILPPSTSSSNTSTRSKLAKVTIIYAGETASDYRDDLEPYVPEAVPVVIILEPLYFGVLPESVIPVVGAIVVVACVSALARRPAIRWLEGIVREGKEKKEGEKEKDE